MAKDGGAGGAGDEGSSLTLEELKAKFDELKASNERLLSHNKELVTDNGKYRDKIREAIDRTEKLTQEFETLKASQNDATGTGDLKGQVAKLTRDLATQTAALADESKKRQTAEDRSKQKTIESALSQVLSEAKVMDIPTAMELASKRVQVDDDGVVTTTIKDDTGERRVPVTLDIVKKMLPPIFFPAEGTGGTGSRGSNAAGAAGLDWERGQRDQDYFNKNRDGLLKMYADAQKANATQ